MIYKSMFLDLSLRIEVVGSFDGIGAEQLEKLTASAAAGAGGEKAENNLE